MTRSKDIEEVLRFWFGFKNEALKVNAEKGSLWWSKDAEVDSQIERRFGVLVEAAAWSDELEEWNDTPDGTLALVVLSDQFPRNIWRGTARAFAVDSRARERANHAVEIGFDLALRPIERVFLYLPFEHSEALRDQERSLELFRNLAAAVPAEDRELFDGFSDFAHKHHEIVARFGRFPHRNATLGRQSTAEERVFLTQPGSSF